MCLWRNWIWPGIVATALLTALIGWFWSAPVHGDLGLRAGDQLKAGQPWAKVAFSGRDGVVSGIAENEIQQKEAVAIALSTYGVRVIDNKTTLPPKSDPFNVSMVKEGAGITLTGSYSTAESRAALVGSMEKAMPGIAIKDELKLASGKPDGFDVLAAYGVSQLTDLATGEVTLSNMDYSIKGLPVDLPAYDKVAAATATLPTGGKLKMADLAIPPLGKPYEISGTYDGNAVNLAGYAPSLEMKAAIEAKAKELFPGKTVNNGLKLAGGAPDAFADAVKFGLGQIAGLTEGSFSLTDLNYVVKGTPADTAAYEASLEAAKEKLPAGVALLATDLVKPAAPEPTPAPEPAPAPVPAKPYIWMATNAADGVKVEGSAPSTDAAAAALDLAKKRFVKADIADAQTVREEAPEGFADVQVNLLKSLSYLTEGKAMITDRIATLEGTAPSQKLADVVAAKTKSGLPGGYELSTVIKVVEPAAISAAMVSAEPYIWSATSNATGVKLEGSVLSPEVGRSVFDLTKSLFAKAEVTNAQVPFNPSPAGFATAQGALLQGLSALNEGKAGLVDQAASLTGVASSQDVKASVISKVTGAMPKGFKLTDVISVVAPPPPAPEAEPAPAPDPNACVASIASILNEGQINFEVSKAIIKEESFGVIGKIAEALKGCPAAKIEIGGHTDSDGNDTSNQTLSDARANAVRDMLTKAGIDAVGVSAKGYGEGTPLVANDSGENKAKNRRIEFRLVQ
jgi:OmpA-OmpF porin, OOP family